MRDPGGRGRRRGHLGPLLSAFADDSLEGRQRRRATAHLAACAVCRHELSQLRAAKRLVGDLPDHAPPSGWVEAQAVGGSAAPRRLRVRNLGLRRKLVRRLGIAGGAALAVLAAGTLLAPAPQTPLDYQQLVRSHLVRVGEPSADQGSYTVEVVSP
jgi:anti-sigma factor RsiW